MSEEKNTQIELVQDDPDQGAVAIKLSWSDLFGQLADAANEAPDLERKKLGWGQILWVDYDPRIILTTREVNFGGEKNNLFMLIPGLSVDPAAAEGESKMEPYYSATAYWQRDPRSGRLGEPTWAFSVFATAMKAEYVHHGRVTPPVPLGCSNKEDIEAWLQDLFYAPEDKHRWAFCKLAPGGPGKPVKWIVKDSPFRGDPEEGEI